MKTIADRTSGEHGRDADTADAGQRSSRIPRVSELTQHPAAVSARDRVALSLLLRPERAGSRSE